MKLAVLLTVLLLSGCATLDNYLQSASNTAKDVMSGFKCDVQGHSFSFCAEDVTPAGYKP